MSLPFTTDQFLEIFAEYNRALSWAVAALWLASLAALALAARNRSRHSRTLTLFLGALWLWNAVAYHAVFFTRINPAAWLFAALFGVQALLFFRAAIRTRLEYFASPGWRDIVGWSLVGYALAYPFLTLALGHTYPASPTFGVPCPTAILTIGALVTVRGGAPLTLAIVPVLWGFIGGSAAAILGVPTDYVLLAAGILMTIMLIVRGIRSAEVAPRRSSAVR